MSPVEGGVVQSKLIRNPGLRARVSVTLVGVALVSVLLLSTVNFVFARLLIKDSVESQLTAVRDTRVQALEIGVERLRSRVSSLAIDPSVAEALVDLSREFSNLNEDLSNDQVENLTALYDAEVVPPFAKAGVDIDSSELVPASVAGRSAQRLYISENPNGFEERNRLDDAGDGSGYSAAHAVHHPMLRALLRNAGMSDLLLVDFDSGEVIYSTMKRIDLGTNAYTGPYAESGLGRAVEKLTTVAPGNTVLSDTFFYVPTQGVPVFFLAAAVRSGSDLVGALITEVPVSALTDVMTAQEDWQRLGLGVTGESYIVGGDRTLRTDTRAWLKDPADYLDRHLQQYDDPDSTDRIALIGSPVLVQPVDNDAVTESLDGNQFSGTVNNYLGTKTWAAASPAAIEGVNWAVVVEVNESETSAALNSLLRRFVLVLAILLPLIAIFGVFLARSLTRPAQTLVRSAKRIADGDLTTEIGDLGQNELGDLGRQLEGVARQLESQEQAIIDEEQHINSILSALLPERLIDRVRNGESAIGDAFDTATVVSMVIDDLPPAIANDNDLAFEIADRLNDGTLAIANQYGAERVQRSSASVLYLTGLNKEDARVPDATDFTLAVMGLVAEIGAEFGFEFTARAGMSTGDVATGVLGSSQLSFGVWGDPPGMAMTLSSLALPGQILADDSVAAQLDQTWNIEAVESHPGLAEDVQAHVVNGRVEPLGGSSNNPSISS